MMIIKNQRIRRYSRTILAQTGLLQSFFDIYTWYHNVKPPINFKKIYNALYISNHGYDSAEDLRIKEFQAREIARLLTPRKVLVAGCARGNAVLAFHNLGIEAWGFDIIPNTLSESHFLRRYLRLGSILNIPYSSKDNFDTFVCTDVFEHIYIKDVPLMVTEIYRIGADSLALIINHDGLNPGHVTLKPLGWWAQQFQGTYRLAAEKKTALVPGIYGLDPSAGRPYFTFWEKWKNRSRPQSR